jgi:hypothetical protein
MEKKSPYNHSIVYLDSHKILVLLPISRTGGRFDMVRDHIKKTFSFLVKGSLYGHGPY